MKRKIDILELIALVSLLGLILAGVLVIRNPEIVRKLFRRMPYTVITPYETGTKESAEMITGQVVQTGMHTGGNGGEEQKVAGEEKVKPAVEQPAKPETVMVEMRNGDELRGKITSRNDTRMTLETAAGPTNITWRAMTTNSFQRLNPALYNELLARLRERLQQQEQEMKAKGYVQYEGEWMPKKEMLARKYRFSNQRVSTTLRSTQYKQTDKSPNGSSIMRRSEWGALMLAFRGMNPEKTYELKLQGIHYLEYRNWGRGSDVPKNTTNTIQKTETLHGKEEYRFEYELPAYEQFKGSARSNSRWGYESEDFSLKVWLDGDLIYDKPKGTFGDYHIIDSF